MKERSRSLWTASLLAALALATGVAWWESEGERRGDDTPPEQGLTRAERERSERVAAPQIDREHAPAPIAIPEADPGQRSTLALWREWDPECLILQVVDREGVPIADLALRLASVRGDGAALALTTDAEGYVVVPSPLPFGEADAENALSVRWSGIGGAPPPALLESARWLDRPAVVEAPEFAVIEVSVVESDGGEAREPVSLRWANSELDAAAEGIEGRSLAPGERLLLRAVPGAKLHLVGRMGEFVQIGPAAVTAPDRAGERGTVELRPGTRTPVFEIGLRFPPGESSAGRRVRIHWGSQQALSTGLPSSPPRTEEGALLPPDEAGLTRLRFSPPVRFERGVDLVLRIPSFEDLVFEDLYVPPAGSVDLGERTLAPLPAALTGKVVDREGTPQSSVGVRIRRGERKLLATTDERGLFALPGPYDEFAPQTLRVQVGRGGSAQCAIVEVPEGTRGLELVLLEPGQLQGTIRFPPELSARPIRVRLRDRGLYLEDRTAFRSVNSLSGRFHFGWLLPGTYDLEIYSIRQRDITILRLEGLVVPEGGTCADRRLRSIDLTGTVVPFRFEFRAPSGSGVPRGSYLLRRSGSSEDWSEGESEWLGESLVLLLPAGRYDFCFTPAEHRPVQLSELSAGSVVELEPVLRVRLRLPPANAGEPADPALPRTGRVRSLDPTHTWEENVRFPHSQTVELQLPRPGSYVFEWDLPRTEGPAAGGTTPSPGANSPERNPVPPPRFEAVDTPAVQEWILTAPSK